MMQKMLAALWAVTRFGNLESSRSTAWQRVIARGVIGLGCAILGAIMLWIAPHDRGIGALLATIVVCVARHFLFSSSEVQVLIPLSTLIAPAQKDGTIHPLMQQSVFNILFIFRPICIFFLFYSRCGFWLPAASALAVAAALVYSNETADNERQYCWIAAWAITILCGAIISRATVGHPGMLLGAILAGVLCWMLPTLLNKLPIRQDRNTLLYAGEALALVAGLLGQAL